MNAVSMMSKARDPVLGKIEMDRSILNLLVNAGLGSIAVRSARHSV